MTPDAHAIALISAAARLAMGAGVGFFQHGTDLENSLKSEQALPYIFLFDPVPKQDHQSASTVKMDCTLTFLDQHTRGKDKDDPLETEAIILRMTTLKDRFLAHLDRNYLLEIENMVWESERLIYAARLTGVVLKFSLKLPRPVESSACALI